MFTLFGFTISGALFALIIRTAFHSFFPDKLARDRKERDAERKMTFEALSREQQLVKLDGPIFRWRLKRRFVKLKRRSMSINNKLEIVRKDIELLKMEISSEDN